MWKHGKRWAYSITYDEGCAALLDHALAVHREYGVPGHVALVASQVGVPRDVPGSSYDGMMILSKDQLHELKKEGWGISCHSMTHAGTTPENADYEVVQSKGVIEEATGMPCPIYCVPNTMGCYPAARTVAQEAGYTAILTLIDKVNTIEEDLLNLGRTALHTTYAPRFQSTFDPYARILQAIDMRGWIIDYCHCPMPGEAIHPAKDCTTQELAQRFEAVCRLGGHEVWLAEPNEVVDYILSKM